MKMFSVFSCSTVADAQAKAAELEAAGFNLQVFEEGVQTATADYRQTNGGECVTVHASCWVVGGTKAD